MILIADSGSTKTDWCLLSGGNVLCRVRTLGINPFHQERSFIESVIAEELMPRLSPCFDNVEPVSCDNNVVAGGHMDGVFFYGAGCIGDKAALLRTVLQSFFSNADNVEVHTDMLGAARAICGKGQGVACILGTGANSCLYDGKDIVSNIPPLGYILGDEGSGAVLGKLFFNSIFKGDLPEEIKNLYLEETGLTYSDIINRVYREPLANRFLATVSEFVGKYKSVYPQLRELVKDNFRSFFIKNVAKYNRADLLIGAIGSIAYYYKEELVEAAGAEGFTIGVVEKSPMAGLIRYHL